MLLLFAFFLGGFPFVRRRFKFHFTSSRCTGILRLYGQSLSRSPYKRNRENNSKLSTSRDPGTPESYKPGLCYTVMKLEYDYIIIISRTFNIIMSLIVENPY